MWFGNKKDMQRKFQGDRTVLCDTEVLDTWFDAIVQAQGYVFHKVNLNV